MLKKVLNSALLHFGIGTFATALEDHPLVSEPSIISRRVYVALLQQNSINPVLVFFIMSELIL